MLPKLIGEIVSANFPAAEFGQVQRILHSAAKAALRIEQRTKVSANVNCLQFFFQTAAVGLSF